MPWSNPHYFDFTSEAIGQYAPERSGVYGLFAAEQWVYIGASNDIQTSLLAHLYGDNECITRLKPSGFVFEVCPVSQQAARQNALIREYQPQCNRPG